MGHHITLDTVITTTPRLRRDEWWRRTTLLRQKKKFSDLVIWYDMYMYHQLEPYIYDLYMKRVAPGRDLPKGGHIFSLSLGRTIARDIWATRTSGPDRYSNVVKWNTHTSPSGLLWGWEKKKPRGRGYREFEIQSPKDIHFNKVKSILLLFIVFHSFLIALQRTPTPLAQLLSRSPSGRLGTVYPFRLSVFGSQSVKPKRELIDGPHFRLQFGIASLIFCYFTFTCKVRHKKLVGSLGTCVQVHVIQKSREFQNKIK